MKPSILDRILGLFVVPESDRLRSLLVPELADLRQQLADARRLAGEAQGRFRAAEQRANDYDGRLEVVKMDLARAAREAVKAEVELLARECDQLREELAATEKIAASYKCVLEACPECKVHGPGCVPHAVDSITALRARVAELEAEVELAEEIRRVPLPAHRRPMFDERGQPIPYDSNGLRIKETP